MGKNVIISTLPNISQNYLPKVNTSNIFANSLVYDDGSSVLINTTTASAYKLDVNGTGRFQGALTGTSATFSGSLIVGTGTTGTQYFANASAEISYSATTGLWRFNNLAGGSAPTTYYQFAADGTPIFSILKSGAATFSSSVQTGFSVLIGTSTNPYGLGSLVVNHDATYGRTYFQRGVNLIEIIPSNGTVANQISSSFTSSGSAYMPLSLSARQTPSDLYLATNGNVGIGTTSPSSKLSVAATSSTTDLGSTGLTIGGATTLTSGNVLMLNFTPIGADSNRARAGIGCEVGADWGKGNLTFYTKDASSGAAMTTSDERMRITSGGSLNFNPNNATAYININQGTGLDGGILFQRNNANKYQLALTGGDVLYIYNYAAGAESMRIASNGDLTVKGSTHTLYTNSGATISFDINVTRARFYQALTIDGALSKGSGSFRIKHPLESKKDTHQLVHSFIEGPQADLIYRGKIKLINGKAIINIDKNASMTEGTFESLCREVQCFTTNETGWNLVKGNVEGNLLKIESNNLECTDEISWIVIGERKDEHIMNTYWTDKNGKVIVEPLINE